MSKITSLILAFFLSLAFISCTSTAKQSTPENTIEKFETAFNERDIDKMLSLFTPEYQAELKAEMELINLLSGIVGFGDIFSDNLWEGVLGVALGDSYVDFEVLSVKYNEDKTMATVLILSVMGADSSIDTVELVKISNHWYLNIENE